MLENREMTPPAHVVHGPEDTVRPLLTLADNWPDNGPLFCADSSLASFKEVRSSSGVTPSLLRLHSLV